MIVTVNGERRELATGATVASGLELLDVAPGARGVAVAVDGEVVPARAVGEAELADGALIEVVAAIGGG